MNQNLKVLNLVSMEDGKGPPILMILSFLLLFCPASVVENEDNYILDDNI